MCGIAGFVNRRGVAADPAILERMTVRLAHRGPDGDGFYVDGPAALGHRRLAVIDLDTGAQPMANEDGTVWVTYNGEIYNEPSLRRLLESRGHRFRTRSDTEVLVHLYEEEGLGFARHLNGMFALALWDGPRQRLVMARDRMGQKPLYYATTASGGMVFGSEPKVLLAHPEIPRRLDRGGLARYLFYEYLPAPHSIWESVRKLPAAHTLVWESGQAHVERYWEPPPPAIDSPTFERSAEILWTDLVESVDRHRRSDVPLGVFLSGGIDSSSVAAAVCALQPASTVRTFSIGFDDPSFDESAPARAVAEYLGTEHHARTFSAESALEILPEVAGRLDEPLGDASILPTSLLCRFARESVTVALGGDGSDELLAGYPTFVAERAAHWYRRFPGPARGLAGAVVRRLPVSHGNFSLDFQLKQFLKGAIEPTPLAHQRWMGSFSDAEIASILIEEPIAVEPEHLAIARALDRPGSEIDPLTRSLWLYQQTYLAEDILTKVDRASMAYGLEVRAPFLDSVLVDRVEALPARYKYGKNQTKRLLKRSVAGRLPPSIIGRRKKGFGIPAARWLRGPLSPLIDRLLGRPALRSQGIFRPEAVARLIDEHRMGVRDHRKPLWTLLMFQLWFQNWLAGS